ncbi:hypothetical protein [Desulfurivibrio alkaliphilus]|uniref:Uncharacterized protein n=1 Tax=Desulfurivibrio alkaliphilus (strain DSM 19089 / UNIQEM U267 / AHT2) TaxID=589865 RepID=D6Z662_DESAT|nr:hypothetical protein [Desulfurivibrio alkaliphilus]ADH86827.1 hypothetical protein DaAHT2_2158 [Desulfurivibrio alkaliphilus AHT 2]
MTLFIVGLLMNLTGIVIGSSRDLTKLCKRVLETLTMALAWVLRWLRRQWSRIWKRPKRAEGHAVLSGVGVGTFTGSCSAYSWNSVPEGIDLPAAIERLRARTDTLQHMMKKEEANRVADVAKLFARLDGLTQDLHTETVSLNEKIDDFDVKPAGQRAIGALLVICGTILMAITALPGMVAQ